MAGLRTYILPTETLNGSGTHYRMCAFYRIDLIAVDSAGKTVIFMNRISTHFLDLEGIKTAYYSTEGEGTPIMLLHGGGVDHAMLSWKTIM